MAAGHALEASLRATGFCIHHAARAASEVKNRRHPHQLRRLVGKHLGKHLLDRGPAGIMARHGTVIDVSRLAVSQRRASQADGISVAQNGTRSPLGVEVDQ